MKARRQQWIHLQCEETVCQCYALAVHGATEGKYCFSKKNEQKTIYASVECPSNSFLFFYFISLTPIEQP